MSSAENPVSGLTTTTVNVPQIIQSILDGQHETEDHSVYRLLTNVSEERQGELLELLAVFCQTHDVFLTFVVNNIKYEIEQTREATILFREDCFAVRCFNRLLFNDQGLTYLNNILLPLIKALKKGKDVIDISNPKDGKFDKNVNKVIKMIDKFMDNFLQSIPQFPILLREALYAIQECINSKFTQEEQGKKNLTLILDFIFFRYICLALIEPNKYLKVEDLEFSKNSVRSFINISKIMNNTVRNATDKYEGSHYKKLVEFMEKQHKALNQFLAKLLDPAEIEKDKLVKSGGIKTVTATIFEKSEARESLEEFLRNVYGQDSSSDTSEPPSPRTLSPHTSRRVIGDAPLITQKYQQFMELVNSNEWDLFIDEKDLKSYSWKDPGTNVLKIKTSLTIKVPQQELWTFATNMKNLSHFWTPEFFREFDLYLDEDGYHEYRIHFDFPFPFSPREWLVSEWDFIDDQNRAIVILDNMASSKISLIQRKKGAVRGKAYVCGYMFEVHDKDPNWTKFTKVTYASPKGAMPKWIANSLSRNATKNAVRFKDYAFYYCSTPYYDVLLL